MVQWLKRFVCHENAIRLRHFPRNTAVLLISEPLWSFPANWYYTYFALFMATVGLSPFQIGLITSFGLVGKILLSLLGGHITDRWGRKRTLIFFDIVSWVIPMALWAVSTRFWHFVLGALLNSFVWIALPAWLCLLFEETPTEHRTKLYAANNAIYIIGGFTLPFAGWVIKNHGVDPGVRMLLLGFSGSMLLMVVIRGILLRESRIGLSIQKRSRDINGRQSLQTYRATLRFLMKNTELRTLLLIGVLFNFALNFANTYNALYITASRGLALSRDLLAVFPLMTSCINLFLTFVVIPRLAAGREGRAILFSLAINLFGYLIFMATPARCGFFVWLAVAAWAVAGGLFIPVREGLWQNLIPDEERARIISLAGVIEGFVMLFAAPLGGWLFQMAARSIYLAGALIIGLSLFVLAHPGNLLGKEQKYGNLSLIRG